VSASALSRTPARYDRSVDGATVALVAVVVTAKVFSTYPGPGSGAPLV
jgi:hypothetical protein